MIVISEQRLSESPYIEWVAHGYTVADGIAMRPAGYNWHLIFTRQAGILRTLVVIFINNSRVRRPGPAHARAAAPVAVGPSCAQGLAA